MNASSAQLPPAMREKISVHPISECWTWTGARNSKGYGCTSDGHGRSTLAHRKAYTLLVGPIEGALTIDHLCRNKLCLNVDHMEPVTRAENSARKLPRFSQHWVSNKPPETTAFADIIDRYFGRPLPTARAGT